MNRVSHFLPLLIIPAVLFQLNCAEHPKTLDLLTIEGGTMGTSFSIKIVKSNRADVRINYDKIESKINALLVNVNRQMSTYLKDSEISRFNQYRKTNWFPISSDFAEVVKTAIEISEKSQGAFDITVGPLVNLWGFGPGGTGNQIPGADEVKAKMKLVGYEKISVRQNPPIIKKAVPEMYCDLSAIAKGFGVDKVAMLLDSLNIENYMVEIGGEVRTSGRNHLGTFWRIGVESPDNSAGIRKVIQISDKSMATSGDYKNYFEKDGVRYSHTIDPHTGKPITHKLASVTVIHESCTIADGMATAIDVLGPEKGYELALKEELPVFMIVRDKQGFVEKMTPEFQKLYMKN